MVLKVDRVTNGSPYEVLLVLIIIHWVIVQQQTAKKR